MEIHPHVGVSEKAGEKQPKPSYLALRVTPPPTLESCKWLELASKSIQNREALWYLDVGSKMKMLKTVHRSVPLPIAGEPFPISRSRENYEADQEE